MARRDVVGGEAAAEHAELIDALVQTASMTMAVLNVVAADNDLSLTQLRVLAILRDRRVRMSALADYLGLDRSTMTGLVERAERRGLLARAPDPTDGRAVEVFSTQAGIELSEALYRRVEQALSTTTARLTRPERNRLQTLLNEMTQPQQHNDSNRGD